MGEPGTTPTSDSAAAADQFGDTSRTKTLLLYVGTVVIGLVLLKLLFMAGAHVHAPKPKIDAASKKNSAAGTEDVIWRLLIAATVIMVVARLIGAAFRRINQPQVVGEIVAGIMLGPSLLGWAWPTVSHQLFSNQVLPYIDVLAQVGLIFFMFLIGLELDVRLIKGRGSAATAVSHMSIVIPFLLGSAAALVVFSTLGSTQGKFTAFALFMGASMSITAFPVLARILTERGIYKTRLGAVTLTCAAVDDVTAWCLLAVVVAVARAHGVGSALQTIGLSAGFIALMILGVRPFMGRLAKYHEEQGHLGSGLLVAVFAGILLSAVATDRIGIHAIFGAFLFGAIMPQRSEFIRELVSKLEDFIGLFLLPLFFAFTGLRTQIGLIGSDPKLWLLCGLILLVAVAGKWGGSTMAARFVGLEWRESLGLGILMNTRGLTELIILNIGLDLKVIPPTLFAMLVIMALVTTFMTTPILSLIYPGDALERMIAAESEEEDEEEGPQRWRILLPIPSSAAAHELVHTAMRLARDRDERAQITLLKVVRLPSSAYRGGPMVQEQQVNKAHEALRPLVQLVEGAGYDALPMVVPATDVTETIVRVVNERRPDLVLLGWRRSPFGRRLLGGHVGDILRRAESDVAVLVDPAGQGIALQKGADILVPWGGGFHEDVGIDLALRLAEASRANVTLIGAADDDSSHDLAERAARAYEETGVWTTPLPVDGDITVATVERAREADLVVLGVSDKWVRDQESLGPLREAVAARASAPLLIVRRHGQPGAHGPSRWFRRQREWMDDTTGELNLVDVERQVASPLAGEPSSSRR